jgi:hypothetical protein
MRLMRTGYLDRLNGMGQWDYLDSTPTRNKRQPGSCMPRWGDTASMERDRPVSPRHLIRLLIRRQHATPQLEFPRRLVLHTPSRPHNRQECRSGDSARANPHPRPFSRLKLPGIERSGNRGFWTASGGGETISEVNWWETKFFVWTL